MFIETLVVFCQMDPLQGNRVGDSGCVDQELPYGYCLIVGLIYILRYRSDEVELSLLGKLQDGNCSQ